MKLRHFLHLTLLAAIWGGSFLFTRISVNEFGPVPLTAMRSSIAALTLAPVLFVSGHWPDFRRNWQHLLVLGMISTAFPFSLIAITTQYTSAGFAAIINSLTPIFSAIFAWLWLKEQLGLAAIIGIILGFAGVLVMVTDGHTISTNLVFLPILCGIAATALYGLTGNYSRRLLHNAAPVAIAAGCQFFASLVLLPASLLFWPETPISTGAWLSAAILGIACTGLAFIMFFQLLANVGVTRTMIVTYLVPVFAMLWGFLFLGEIITLKMLAGAGLILTGIGLTTGIFRNWKKRWVR